MEVLNQMAEATSKKLDVERVVCQESGDRTSQNIEVAVLSVVVLWRIAVGR